MTRESPAHNSDNDDTGIPLTPARRQYQEIKTRYPDAILFFHIGDFYETFGTDAELISRELEIVLTSRSKSGDNRIPLAGVPYHAAEGYIAKLVGRGYKVAVCDQLEDARNVKGIVKRDVVRVITPGTVIETSMLPSTAATYLMALCPDPKEETLGIALLDISTGEFFISATESRMLWQDVLSEIARYRPSECIVPSGIPQDILRSVKEQGVVVTKYRDEEFSEHRARSTLTSHFHVSSLAGYGCDSISSAIGAAGAALAYAKEMQNSPLTHISSLSTRTFSQNMMLDAITLRNLEITESIRRGAKGATLLTCLDITRTPMGSRLLHRHITRPLTLIDDINQRLDAVEFFVNPTAVRLALRTLLAHCKDIERIAARIAYGNASPRDLVALKETLAALPKIKTTVQDSEEKPIPALIRSTLDNLRERPDTIDLIARAIADNPPATAKNGGVLREGYSKELDELKRILHSGKDWIAELQQKERERTGIKSLKIGYNKIFGYYIEVTRPNLPLVPSHYERRQTTATGERYTILELRDKETIITNADERLLSLERELYGALIESLRTTIPDLQETAAGIATLDVASTHAEIAQIHDYIRPSVNNGDAIVIREGRHPVVERGVTGGFVPNDTDLSSIDTQIMIITGANMAGKSTYMRAVALICIMTQAGSFVPARHANIGVIDRIFTRVGAFDDLASGQSTFFVEMLELANILNNVSTRSLVILDEIGRGTSTIDGSSIAKAVLEYLHGRSPAGPKTLFATHFHELIDLEGALKRVKNYHFAVKDTKKTVVFLRKLIPGATDKSYGIHVARLAGIPRKVTERADYLLSETMNRTILPGTRPQRYTQLLLVNDAENLKTPASHPVLDELSHINPDNMTPLQALSKLIELCNKLQKKEGTE